MKNEIKKATAKKAITAVKKPTKKEQAHEFYAQEHSEYGMHFDHVGCIEDIHRIYGSKVANAVNNDIARDIPELGIDLI